MGKGWSWDMSGEEFLTGKDTYTSQVTGGSSYHQQKDMEKLNEQQQSLFRKDYEENNPLKGQECFDLLPS